MDTSQQPPSAHPFRVRETRVLSGWEEGLLDDPTDPAFTRTVAGLLDGPPGGVLASAMETCLDHPAGSGGLGDLDDDALVELAAAAQRLTAWAVSVQVRAVGELAARWSDPLTNNEKQIDVRTHRGDLGHRAAVAEIALAAGMSQYAVEQRLEAALGMASRLPATFAGLCAGELEWAKAWEIHARTKHLSIEAARVVEAHLLPLAVQVGLPVLREALKGAALDADPASGVDAAKRAHERRSVRFAPGAEEASGAMTVFGSADAVAAAQADLNRLTEAVLAAQAELDAEGAGQPIDDRDPGAIRADIVFDLIAAAASALDQPDDVEDEPGQEETSAERSAGSMTNVQQPPSVRRRARRGKKRRESARYLGPTKVVVTVPLSTLLGLSDASGHLAGHGPIPAEMARWIAATAMDGSWQCAITDDRAGHPHGTLLGLGRPTRSPAYRPPAATEDFVRTRDRTCRFPGCRRAAHRCDLDHAHPWRDPETRDCADVGAREAGETCACNLHALCRSHHRLKHAGVGFRIDPATGIWTTPTRRTYTGPAPVLPHAPVPVPRPRRRPAPTPDDDPPPF